MAFPFGGLVDWNRAGNYLGTGKNVTSRMRSANGLSWGRGKDQDQERAPAAAGEATFVLDNRSRDYSPGNASSPIHPNVRPGCNARIRSVGIAGGLLLLQDDTNLDLQDNSDLQLQDTPSRNLWTGILDDVAQFPDRLNLSVGIRCFGTLNRLIDKSVSTPLYENITIDQAIGYVLDAAGWPALERSLQPSSVVLRYFWADREDAFQLIEFLRLTEAIWASIYENTEGHIVFENRDARTTETRSTVSQATFTESDMVSISYSPNFKDVVQAVSIAINEREPQALDVIWSYGQTLVLAANEIKKLKIRASDPFLNPAIPSAFGTNAVQAITASATLTNGSFVGSFRGEQFTINHNDSVATIQSTLEAVTTIGAGNVLVGGGPFSTMPVTIEFRGTLKYQAIELIVIVSSSLNTVSSPATINISETMPIGVGVDQEFTFAPSAVPITSGSCKFKIGSVTTPLVLFSASAANVETAFDNTSLFNPGDQDCTGGPLASADIKMTVHSTQLGSPPISKPVVVNSSLMASQPTATVAVSETVKGSGPDYVVTAGSVADLTFDALAQSGTITIQAGSGGLTMTGLQLRAQPLIIVRTHERSYPEDLTEIEDNGGQILRPEIRSEISLAYGDSYPMDAVLRYLNPLPAIRIKIAKKVDDPGNDALFQREISDMLTVVNDQIGLNDKVHIENMNFKITGGTLLEAEFGCQIAFIPPPMFHA
ncbi:MAG: hypothetical protein WBV94_20650 [Blastocatellia bacterium]